MSGNLEGYMLSWKSVCRYGRMCSPGFYLNARTRIRFWEDKWLGEESLRAVFPRLYMISVQKEAMIADIMDKQNQDNWDFHFTRHLRDWEKASTWDSCPVGKCSATSGITRG